MRAYVFFTLLFTTLGAHSQTWQHFRMAESPCQLVVSDSMIWVGGQDFGLVGMDPATANRQIEYRTDNSPLLADHITTLEAGPEGSLWVGHDRGVSVKHGNRWHGSLTLPQGVARIAPYSATQAWVQTPAGKLWWFDGQAFTDSLQMNSADDSCQAFGLRPGIDGRTWVATREGLLRLGQTRVDTIAWEGTPWASNDSYPLLFPDQQGGVWACSAWQDSFAYYQSATGWTTYPVGTWFAGIHLDQQDRLWISQSLKLLHWTPTGIQATREHIGTIAGDMHVPTDQVFQIDHNDQIWTLGADSYGGRGTPVRYDLDGSQTYFLADPHNLWGRGVTAMDLDTAGNLYVCPPPGGPLMRYHPASQEWTVFNHHPQIMSIWWDIRDVSADGQQVWTISRYQDFGRSEIEFEGFQSLDLVTGEWTFFSEDQNMQFRRFSSRDANPLLLSGIPVYVLQGDTLQALDPPSPFPKQERMSELAWDSQGQIWAVQTGSNHPRRIWRFNQQEGWQQVSFAQDSIASWQSVLIDAQDVKWIVGKAAVLIVDDRFPAALGRAETWLDRNALGLDPREEITVAKLGPQGYLWMATSHKRLLRYDCEQTLAYSPPGNTVAFPTRPFYDMEIDPRGRIFLSNIFDGLYMLTFDAALPPAPACMAESQAISEDWTAFPNPASQTITISHGNPSVGTVRLQWYDQQGRLIREQETTYQHPGLIRRVDDLANGIYTVLVSSENHQWSLKVWVK